MKNSVIALDGIDEGIANFHLWFLVQLSAFLGFYPANSYVAGSYFDIIEGGFTLLRPEHNRVIEKQDAELLGRLMGCGVDELGGLHLNRVRRGEFLKALLHYFGYHLDSINKVQSVKILSEVF